MVQARFSEDACRIVREGQTLPAIDRNVTKGPSESPDCLLVSAGLSVRTKILQREADDKLNDTLLCMPSVFMPA